jgi:sulfide:quinone oxidoreductase
MSTRSRTIVVGGGFAGLVAAKELRHRLPREHEVVLISANDELTHTPSLSLVPFGLRDRSPIMALIRPLLASLGISFRHAPMFRLDLAGQRVVTPLGNEPYDHLVLATGSTPAFDGVEGMGPRRPTHSISSWADATRARAAIDRLVDDPGPVVIGAAWGASCLDYAYEVLLGLLAHLRRRDLAGRVPVAFVTPEPFLGHVGRGDDRNRAVLENLLASQGVEVILGARLRRVRPDELELSDGRALPASFAMIVPPLAGLPVLRGSSIVDERGFVITDRDGRSPSAPMVYAAGGASAYRQVPAGSPCGPPSAGHLAEADARAVAGNVAAAVLGEPLVAQLDEAIVVRGLPEGPVGQAALIELGSRRQRGAWRLPGPEARWAIESLGRYFLDEEARAWAR